MIFFVFLLATVILCPHVAASKELRVAVVQRAIQPELALNRDQMIRQIGEAAKGGARLVIFPEGSLWGQNARTDEFAAAREAIAQEARRAGVYVIYGEFPPPSAAEKSAAQAATVVGPDGRELFHYVKHHNRPAEPLPDLFHVDGTAAGVIICADRWLRTVEELPIHRGAKISVEIADNFREEWVEPLGWYWYVARALRNNVWVVFANSSRGVNNAGHGHSAVIAPDGRVVSAFPDDRPGILWATIDPEEATAEGARRRSSHPVVGRFWEQGQALEGLDSVGRRTRFVSSRPWELTLAAAQVTGSLAEIEAALAQATRSGVRLIVFPACAAHTAWLPTLQDMSRRFGTTLVIGVCEASEPSIGGCKTGQAVVVNPQGKTLTRCWPVHKGAKWKNSTDLSSLIFPVEDRWGLVLVGQDLLWTEVIEAAACRGVQILVHLDNDPRTDPQARQQRLQSQAVAGSFGMVAVMANVVDSAIWEDLDPRSERRRVIQRLPWPPSGLAEIYSAFSANLLARAKPGDKLLVARLRLTEENSYYQDRVARYPMLRLWMDWAAEHFFPAGN
jgi:predicted amidohydrolase